MYPLLLLVKSKDVSKSSLERSSQINLCQHIVFRLKMLLNTLILISNILNLLHTLRRSLNRCLLFERYSSIIIIDDNISCLVIVINDNDGDITVPIIVNTEIANKMIPICEDNSLISIKDKTDSDEIGLIIKPEKFLF